MAGRSEPQTDNDPGSEAQVGDRFDQMKSKAWSETQPSSRVTQKQERDRVAQMLNLEASWLLRNMRPPCPPPFLLLEQIPQTLGDAARFLDLAIGPGENGLSSHPVFGPAACLWRPRGLEETALWILEQRDFLS